MITRRTRKQNRSLDIPNFSIRCFLVILYSWLLPWWTIDAEELGHNLVQMRPWGLEINEPLGNFVIFLTGGRDARVIRTFMWAYLV